MAQCYSSVTMNFGQASRRFRRLRHALGRARSLCFLDTGERCLRLVFSDAFGRVLRARLDRPRLRSAWVGNQPDIFLDTEVLDDYGFVSGSDFFETSPDDKMHPGKSLCELDAARFDVGRETALLASLSAKNVIPLRRYIRACIETASAPRMTAYRTALNPMKLALVAAGACMAPRDGAIVEAGVYMGGTTVFLHGLQKRLGFVRRSYALDTYEGMPAPTEKDIENAPFVYTEGMFNDNRQVLVSEYFRRSGAADVVMIAGLVQDTIQRVSEPIAMMLLDCDQYAGTYGGLNGVVDRLVPGGMIIVDDSSVVGVDRAITEFCTQHREFRRVPHITHNFDLLMRRSLE
jgi:hypothetical protein